MSVEWWNRCIWRDLYRKWEKNYDWKNFLSLNLGLYIKNILSFLFIFTKTHIFITYKLTSTNSDK